MRRTLRDYIGMAAVAAIWAIFFYLAYVTAWAAGA